jgi:hypothetical protein
MEVLTGTRRLSPQRLLRIRKTRSRKTGIPILAYKVQSSDWPARISPASMFSSSNQRLKAPRILRYLSRLVLYVVLRSTGLSAAVLPSQWRLGSFLACGEHRWALVRAKRKLPDGGFRGAAAFRWWQHARQSFKRPAGLPSFSSGTLHVHQEPLALERTRLCLSGCWKTPRHHFRDDIQPPGARPVGRGKGGSVQTSLPEDCVSVLHAASTPCLGLVRQPR